MTMDDERSKKNSGIRYPVELKKKALLELSESGDTEAAARHYNINKQTLYNWKSNIKRKNKRFEGRQIEENRHFQELLKLKEENAKLKERVRLLRDIVKKTVQILPKKKISKRIYSQRGLSSAFCK